MAKVWVPKRPETKHIRGFTQLKSGSTITSSGGNTFKIGNGVYVNGEGVSDLENREKDWHHYADQITQSISGYNKRVDERNASIKKSLEQTTRSRWGF